MWQTASSPRANAGSTSAGRMTSACINRTPAGTILASTGGLVVHHRDRVSVREQAAAQVGADEPAPPVTSTLIFSTPSVPAGQASIESTCRRQCGDRRASATGGTKHVHGDVARAEA